MQKLIITLFILCLAVVYAFETSPSSPDEGSKINWLSFEEAVKKAEKNPKPLFIDVYTYWCGWCKVMDRKTFTDPNIIKEVNKNFYAVKFNAETRDTINFKGKEFVFIANGRRGYNELAATLLSNRLAYPTVVFMTDKLSKVYAHPGYKKVPDLSNLLGYYKGNTHNKMDYNTYLRSKQPK